MKSPSKGRKNSDNVRPDEVYSRGAVSVARLGANVVWQSHMSQSQFNEMQKELSARLPDVVREIDVLVANVANQVKTLPAAHLLHRAWWEMAARYISVDAESEIDFDDANLLRMIDYVQSVIASVEPISNQQKDVSDEDWKALGDNVQRLFHLVNFDYQVSRTAQNRIDDPNVDLNLEEYRFKAQIYWCNVRGNRYQIHEPAYLRDMLLPHSDVLSEIFGISGEQFVTEITNIWHSLTFGIGEAFEQLDRYRSDAVDAMEEKLRDDPTARGAEDSQVLAAVVREKGCPRVGRPHLLRV